MKNDFNGFSLIELLVAIAIIATIIGVSLPNLLGARQRARDTRRKSDLQQFKTALQLYYNDYRLYPGDSGGGLYNIVAGCGVNGTTNCPCETGKAFAAGGNGCDTVYMTAFPNDFGTSMWYYQKDYGADFCLKVTLENASDPDIDLSSTRCASKCTGAAALQNNDFAVCSE